MTRICQLFTFVRCFEAFDFAIWKGPFLIEKTLEFGLFHMFFFLLPYWLRFILLIRSMTIDHRFTFGLYSVFLLVVRSEFRTNLIIQDLFSFFTACSYDMSYTISLVRGELSSYKYVYIFKDIWTFHYVVFIGNFILNFRIFF